MIRRMLGLLVPAATLVALNFGGVAEAAKPQPAMTCTVNPGDTVVDYTAHSTFLTLTWYDDNDEVRAITETTLKGGGKFTQQTPADAVRSEAQITATPLGVKLSVACT
jgi:hypothetical protein